MLFIGARGTRARFSRNHGVANNPGGFLSENISKISPAKSNFLKKALKLFDTSIITISNTIARE